MFRIPSIALALVVWLFATNHCLLAGALEWHGCESSQCDGHHGLDHSDGCHSACETLEKPILSKQSREAGIVPFLLESDSVPFSFSGESRLIPPDTAHFSATPPDARGDRWRISWRFIMRAAAQPGAPQRV